MPDPTPLRFRRVSSGLALAATALLAALPGAAPARPPPASERYAVVSNGERVGTLAVRQSSNPSPGRDIPQVHASVPPTHRQTLAVR